jgi:hypothetical protein
MRTHILSRSSGGRCVANMARSMGCRGGLLSHTEEVERGRWGLIRTPVGRDGGSWKTTCGWPYVRLESIAGRAFHSRTVFRNETLGS